MRILYHHRTRSSDAQGIHILEMLRAFRALGHDVRMACLVDPETARDGAKSDAAEPASKALLRRIPWGNELVQLAYNFVGIPMLAAKLARWRADFIYERYSLFNFSGVAAARLFRIPIILEVNSPFALEHARDKEIRGYALGAWTERAICNLATRVIVVSTPLRRILIASGVRPEKIVVMSNGIDLNHFRRESSCGDLRARLGLEGKTVFGFVGWFRSWHGLEFLLEAFHRADLGSRGARLVLVGDGPAMPGLRAFVASHRLEPYVIFTGPLPHQEIPRYIELFAVAVQPAANEYCCPMKILEYMGMAKPIVAPRQENIEELLQDGREALLFTPGDADSLGLTLSRMLEDPAAAAEMGRRGLEAIVSRDLLWTDNARKAVALAQASVSG